MTTKKAVAKKPGKPVKKAAAKARRIKAGTSAVATAQDVTIAPDTITIGRTKHAPIEVIQAAALWLDAARHEGWSLRDARNAEIDKPRVER